MKASEAPEKIYMNWVNYPLEEMQVEYIRKDAFIEKAVKWLNRNTGFFNEKDFRKAMKGE